MMPRNIKEILSKDRVDSMVFKDKIMVSVKKPHDALPVFVNCRFENLLSFAGIDELNANVLFDRCHFKHFHFFGNPVKGRVEFRNCRFEDLMISSSSFHSSFLIDHCIFENKVEIEDSVFHQLVQIKKSSFLGGTNIFSKHDSFGAVGFKGGLELS